MYIPGRSTDCGHMFCLDCILRWLATQLEDLLGGDPTMVLGDHLTDGTRDPLRDPEAFVVAAKLVDALELRFSCPSCRSVMIKRPIPALAMEEVMCGLGMGEKGEVGGVTVERLHHANASFEQYLLF